MPTSKNNRRGQEAIRRGKLSEKSSSFHGRLPAMPPAVQQLRRPKTLPNLLPIPAVATLSPEARPKLTKLLLNVTIQGSVGAVQVLMSPENTVADLVAAAIRQYVKECRRPILRITDSSGFDLHYSQFSLERLEKEEKLMELGSRNFFLCTKKVESDGGSGTERTTSSSSSCSKEAEKASKTGIPWLKFMDFLL
ncbi:hypothetical protein JRO89_XSUnG0248100 [Xanthoceras sorbifolium]|uniref:DUF7054 domain-containing protein n=1 Tax=Xanthoceras sorbifolium TaxID=99658 RepID=A0ABQ8GZ55_9ROSI|nr:hypothetical protein JRO89_XSUnG0248100 [Xanthoceras sorbifolium]